MAPRANTEVQRQEAPRAAQPLLRSPNSNPTVVPPFGIDYQLLPLQRTVDPI